MEYTIVFDGSHRNADRDLLCCEPIPEKRLHVPVFPELIVQAGVSRPRKRKQPLHAPYGAIEQTITAALRWRALGARELSHATGFSYEQIKHAMERLRRAGTVTRQRTPAEDWYPGAPLVRYRLVRGDEA